jgi:hypothetical protein
MPNNLRIAGCNSAKEKAKLAKKTALKLPVKSPTKAAKKGGNGIVQQTSLLDDVFVGDVWVASGQSNMEFTLRRAETAGQCFPLAGSTD